MNLMKGTLSRRLPLTIAVGKCLATSLTASRICGGKKKSVFYVGMKQSKKKQRIRERAAVAAYGVRHERAVGVVDDWRESAVVVEEHHDALPLRLRNDVAEVSQSGRVLPLRRRDQQC